MERLGVILSERSESKCPYRPAVMLSERSESKQPYRTLAVSVGMDNPNPPHPVKPTEAHRGFLG